MGRSHALAYHRIPGFEICGIVTRSADSRGKLNAELGGGYAEFADFHEALSETKPDAVSISTYPDTHGPYAEAAFDAVFAASDLIAIGALRALQDAKVDVPRQVAVVGFDDIPAASLTNPPLSTVMQDTRRAGELLVETLLRQIAGESAVNSVIPTRLVVRKSG